MTRVRLVQLFLGIAALAIATLKLLDSSFSAHREMPITTGAMILVEYGVGIMFLFGISFLPAAITILVFGVAVTYRTMHPQVTCRCLGALTEWTGERVLTAIAVAFGFFASALLYFESKMLSSTRRTS